MEHDRKFFGVCGPSFTRRQHQLVHAFDYFSGKQNSSTKASSDPVTSAAMEEDVQAEVLDDASGNALDDAPHDALDDASGNALDDAPHDTLDDAPHDALEDAPENVLLHAARNGDVATVKRLLREKEEGQLQLDVSCKGVCARTCVRDGCFQSVC